jgi:hypothetical protein
MGGRRVVLAAGFVAAAALLGAGCAKKEVDTSHPALAAATSWLKVVDEGKYEQSWKEAAPLFQKAVTAEAWGKQVEAARSPFGKVLSRKPASMNPQKTMPGAPDGEYVVIQFETSFEKKASGVETVTPMKAPDGAWRVAGYYIK